MPEAPLVGQSTATRCPKRRYPTEDAAWVAIDEAADKRVIGKKESSTYRCRRCKGWHLTAQAPRWARRTNG